MSPTHRLRNNARQGTISRAARGSRTLASQVRCLPRARTRGWPRVDTDSNDDVRGQSGLHQRQRHAWDDDPSELHRELDDQQRWSNRDLALGRKRLQSALARPAPPGIEGEDHDRRRNRGSEDRQPVLGKCNPRHRWPWRRKWSCYVGKACDGSPDGGEQGHPRQARLQGGLERRDQSHHSGTQVAAKGYTLAPRGCGPLMSVIQHSPQYSCEPFMSITLIG